MKSKLFDILLLFLFMAVLSSCREKDHPLDGVVSVSFSFSTQENMTRAGHDWDDNNYDSLIGSDYDSRIKFNSLRAFIYDNAGYICEITNGAYFELGETSYRFLGQIELTPAIYDRVKDNKPCKVMLVANSTLSGTPNDFDKATFSVDNLKMPNGFIPMWGVTTATLNFQPNQDLGNIYLLRSAAKVEIKLSQSLIDEGIKIEDAFINKHAPNGYLFPTGWNSVGNTVSLSHSGCYNPFRDVLNSSQYFTKSSDSEVVIYLPEMETEGADITIHVKKGDEIFQFANAIKFANYDNNGDVTDEKFNIVRNHHYQYTITKVNTGAGLDLDCSVLDWEEDLEEWVYSDVPTVSDDGHINWTIGTVNGNRVSLTPSSPTATFTFGLETPLGASWRAEFVTIKGKQNAFKFTQGLNATISADGSYATGNIGEMITLVVGTNGVAEVENNEAYLRILVVLPDSRTIRVSSMLHHDANSEYVIVQTP